MKRCIFTAACCGLTMVMLTSCKWNLGETSVEMPWWWMLGVVILPSLIIAALVIGITAENVRKTVYVCPHCGGRFKPGWRGVFAPHIQDEYKLKCPHCQKRDWCSPSYKQEK